MLVFPCVSHKHPPKTHPCPTSRFPLGAVVGGRGTHLGLSIGCGTKLEPWQVETWTETCGLPLLFIFEPRPFKHRPTKMGSPLVLTTTAISRFPLGQWFGLPLLGAAGTKAGAKKRASSASGSTARRAMTCSEARTWGNPGSLCPPRVLSFF